MTFFSRHFIVPNLRKPGIVTLEDVLEKVIRGDITDETDTSGFTTSLSLPRGVVTTSLSRKMGRSHTMGELFSHTGEEIGMSTGSERRLSRGRARGHSASRNNLLALSSINVVAGDVRHKERDAISPSGRRSLSHTPRARTSHGGESNKPSVQDYFSDVVDTVVVDEGVLSEYDSNGSGPDTPLGRVRGNEEFVHVPPTELTHLLGNTTSKLNQSKNKTQQHAGRKPRFN